jgi:ComF family protein
MAAAGLGRWIMRALADFALPQDCFLCGVAAGAQLLCARCAADLPHLPEALCPVCAMPSPAGAICGACLKDPPRFDATRAAYAYDFPLDRIVQALKYQGRLAVLPFLGEALAAGDIGDADLIVPLPLHPSRLKERGFNQALEIARVVSRHTHIPIDWRSCERSHDSAPQASLPRAERRRNVRGAFLCRTDLAGQRIAVVDDVMTTGSTLDEFARVLKKAGAVHVTNLVVARTLK